jgi:hypothetical protein
MVELSTRIAPAGHLDRCRVAQVQPSAARQPEQIDTARGDILADLSNRYRETGGPQLIE